MWFELCCIIRISTVNFIIINLWPMFVCSCMPWLDQHIPKLGRKLCHQIGLWGVVIPCVSIAVFYATGIARNHPILITVFATIANVMVNIVWIAVEMYSVELFPTALRNTANGLAYSSARIGAILSPQIVYLATLMPEILYIILASACVFNAILAIFFLPETKNRPLPDMRELEDFSEPRSNLELNLLPVWAVKVH